MITCIGEILIDRFQDENGTSDNIGGAPFNVAIAIKRSGGKSSFYGAVGKDELGMFIKKETSKLGLDNLYVNELDNHPTTIALVTLNNGERSFKFIRDNAADYQLSFPLPSFIDESNIVHIGSLMLSEEIGREFVDKLIKYLKERNILISFDINYREDIFKGRKDIADIYKHVIDQIDILKISDEEIPIFGEEYINSLKNKLICLSLGSKGSEYRYNDMKGFVPSKKVKPVDTTGAGDAFFGGVLSQIDGYRLEELNKCILNDAFRFANGVGALTTLGKGAINQIPTKEEVIKFINS